MAEVLLYLDIRTENYSHAVKDFQVPFIETFGEASFKLHNFIMTL